MTRGTLPELFGASVLARLLSDRLSCRLAVRRRHVPTHRHDHGRQTLQCPGGQHGLGEGGVGDPHVEVWDVANALDASGRLEHLAPRRGLVELDKDDFLPFGPPAGIHPVLACLLFARSLAPRLGRGAVREAGAGGRGCRGWSTDRVPPRRCGRRERVIFPALSPAYTPESFAPSWLDGAGAGDTFGGGAGKEASTRGGGGDEDEERSPHEQKSVSKRVRWGTMSFCLSTNSYINGWPLISHRISIFLRVEPRARTTLAAAG